MGEGHDPDCVFEWEIDEVVWKSVEVDSDYVAVLDGADTLGVIEDVVYL